MNRKEWLASLGGTVRARPKRMRPMNERLAWLAGILDGEGYISATVSSVPKKTYGGKSGHPRKGEVRVEVERERYLRFQIRIGNTDAAMINEIASIAETLGIRYFIFSHCPKQRGQGRYKELFGIHFQSKDRAKRLLLAVLPWLITKRPQAELLLKMISRREAILYNAGALDDSILCEQLVHLRGLNRRGTGGNDVPAPGQFSAITRQESFPRDVVGAQRGAEHPHLTEPAALRTEPSEGIGETRKE